MDIVHRSQKQKPNKVVYAQLRQAVRGKDGKLKVVKTKLRTFHNATIEQVESILEGGGGNHDDKKEG